MLQSALVQEADDNTVILPSNVRQWRVVRNKAAPLAGTYYGYDNIGNKETIGGPGVPLATVGYVIPYSSGALGSFNNVTPQYLGWIAFSTREDVGNFNSPRPGILDNLSIFVAQNDIPNPTVFTVRFSTGGGAFTNTTQTITVPALGTGQFFSVGAAVPIIKGDRVSLEVIPGAGGGGGPQGGLFMSGGLEVK